MKQDLEALVPKPYFVPLTKVYLAIPYSGMEDESYQMANEVTAQLLNLKQYVFSPISHSHDIAKTGLVSNTYDLWLDLDKNFVEWCDEVYVVVPRENSNTGLLKVLNSKGVLQELLWAKELKKPVKFLTYDLKTKVIVPHDNM